MTWLQTTAAVAVTECVTSMTTAAAIVIKPTFGTFNPQTSPTSTLEDNLQPGPSQAEKPSSPSDVELPNQPKNFPFPKKQINKQNRSFVPTWFQLFRWLHYVEENYSVLCFFCAPQNTRGYLRTSTKKEMAFIKGGFSNWKNAIERFKEHQTSNCHKVTIEYEFTIPKTYGNVLEMSSDQIKKSLQYNRCCLMKIIENLQYFCWQRQAMQGDTGFESNFFQLTKLRSRDDSRLVDWMKKKNDKYMSHEIQNEIIAIMAHQLLRDIVKDIGSNVFSIIADEYTDIGNKEQLTICLRWIDDQLEVHEDFLGFYNIPNIQSTMIVQVIKDALIRLQLLLTNCRGQCYDGASNMLGKRSGVAKKYKSANQRLT